MDRSRLQGENITVSHHVLTYLLPFQECNPGRVCIPSLLKVLHDLSWVALSVAPHGWLIAQVPTPDDRNVQDTLLLLHQKQILGKLHTGNWARDGETGVSSVGDRMCSNHSGAPLKANPGWQSAGAEGTSSMAAALTPIQTGNTHKTNATMIWICHFAHFPPMDIRKKNTVGDSFRPLIQVLGSGRH